MATAIGVEVRPQEDAGALDSALERAKTGDEDAFRELVDSVSPEFTHLLLRRLCPDHESASAVLQDAWLSAWERLLLFASVTNLRQWVYRVASNGAISRLRHLAAERRCQSRSSSVPYAPVVRDVATDFVCPDESVTVLVRGAIERLPARLRLATALHYVHGHGSGEIASLLGLSNAAIKMRLHRARGILRRSLRSVATD